MLLKYTYSFFVAILLATFVGVGIAAFYKAPKYPEYPIETKPISMAPTGEVTESAQMQQERINFEKESREFQKENEIYNKNVSTIAIAASLLILTASITLLSRIDFISDGLMIGGIFTLTYAIVRGFNAGDELYRFIVVSIGLAVTLFLGYWKFVRKGKISKANH